ASAIAGTGSGGSSHAPVVSRGSTTVRSYIGRSREVHGAASWRRANSSSAPVTHPGTRSYQAPEPSSWCSRASNAGSKPGCSPARSEGCHVSGTRPRYRTPWSTRTCVRIAPARRPSALRRRAPLLRRAEVDPQGEDPVLQRPLGVADDGEVHVVDLRLADELQALRPRHRRQGAVADRLRPVPEALDHRLDVERVTHAVHGNGRSPAGRTPAGRRSAPAGVVPVQVRGVACRTARRPRRRGPGRAAVGLGAHAAPRAVGTGAAPGVAGQAAGPLPRRRALDAGAPIAATPDPRVLVPAGQAPARGRGRHAVAGAVAATPARLGGPAPG